MEKCPYKNHSWKSNIPAHIMLLLIIVAIAVLYYLHYVRMNVDQIRDSRIGNIERSFDFDYNGDPRGGK